MLNKTPEHGQFKRTKCEIWKRGLTDNDDPAVEFNMPVLSVRSHWPFLYWFRDRWTPWSVHIHLPGHRVLSLRWRH